jgi:hypothetical protein
MVESLWLSSNWRANYEHASIRTFVGVDPEDLVIPPYCEPRSMHPSLSTIAYTPFRDLFIGNFVLMWPSDPIIYHI